MLGRFVLACTVVKVFWCLTARFIGLTASLTTTGPGKPDPTVAPKSADGFDGQEVMLRLEEQHGNTSHYSTYREQRYVLNEALK